MLTSQNSFVAELRQSYMQSISLEGDFALPEEESSEEDGDSILVFARSRHFA